MIKLTNVTKVFQQKNKTIHALDHVSLHVPAGKIVGVIGASGAGKSTLIRCVNLLERPTSGEILIDGINLLGLSSKQLAKERTQIGMIFQHFNLLSSCTVFDNIALPLELIGVSKAEIRTRVNELLALVGLADKRTAFPATLSGGQKQRVAIARTLATNPKVLLCDEATSALDPGTTTSILSLLKDINIRLGITILLITHEMDVVKSICDKVAVISDGKLIEQGTVGEIFSNPSTALAKEFIASSLTIKLPIAYLEKLTREPGAGKNPLLKLEFTGISTNKPVVSEVSRLFSIDNNIVFAQLEYAGDVQFGALVVEVVGSAENHSKALEYYKEKQVKVEVLGYV